MLLARSESAFSWIGPTRVPFWVKVRSLQGVIYSQPVNTQISRNSNPVPRCVLGELITAICHHALVISKLGQRNSLRELSVFT